mmetsp:Transcript_5380/g.6801  ORF Transcript_5380/g.6801 Transcript_5380/m.6801 type:complete len:229 (+) Transcript_5380:215-901(+)
MSSSKTWLDLLPRQLRVFISVQMETDPVSNIPEHWAEHEKFSFFSMYALSSWTYASVGILMLTVFYDNYYLDPPIPIPIEMHAIGVIAQSFVTYIADVHYASKTTHWHFADRCIATLNTLSLCLSGFFISWTEVLIFALVVPTGLILLSNSRHCRLTDVCMNAYTRWHAFWHAVYPSAVLGWLNYRAFPEYRSLMILATVFMCGLVIGIQTFHPRIFHRNDSPKVKST